MNILICDDKNDDALELKRMISELYPGYNTDICNSASDTLSYICSGNKPFVCFLDIILPEMDGIALAQEMRKNGYKGHIVFLTVSGDYAIQSYKVKAYSYLLKPTSRSEVSNLLKEFEEAFNKANTRGLPVKTKKMSRFILYKDISHVEVIRRKVFFRLINGEEIIVNSSLSEIAKTLLKTDSRFIQCHGSFLLNMENVSSISGSWIIMNDGAKIPVSKRYSHVKDKILKWMFEED